MGACGPAKLDDLLVCCSGWDVALRNNDPGLALWDHSGTAAFSILHPHLSLTCSGCKLFVAGTGDNVCVLLSTQSSFSSQAITMQTMHHDRLARFAFA